MALSGVWASDGEPDNDTGEADSKIRHGETTRPQKGDPEAPTDET